MSTSITQKIIELKNDRLHGANWLSLKALYIMNSVIKNNHYDTVSNFVNELKTIAFAITEARPNMTSIANYISQLLNEITIISQEQKPINNVKDAAQIRVNELIKFVGEAPRRAAEYAAKIITHNDIVITCSYSSTVCETFAVVKEKAIKFSVIIAESRYDGNSYGRMSAKQLKQHQITTMVIPDEEIDLYVPKANKALVGADTVLADGSIINGTPGYKLAQAASITKIQFYSVCETAKFDSKSHQQKPPHIESGFDLILSRWISGLITEMGMTNPTDITNQFSRWRNIDENH